MDKKIFLRYTIGFVLGLLPCLPLEASLSSSSRLMAAPLRCQPVRRFQFPTTCAYTTSTRWKRLTSWETPQQRKFWQRSHPKSPLSYLLLGGCALISCTVEFLGFFVPLMPDLAEDLEELKAMRNKLLTVSKQLEQSIEAPPLYRVDPTDLGMQRAAREKPIPVERVQVSEPTPPATYVGYRLINPHKTNLCERFLSFDVTTQSLEEALADGLQAHQEVPHVQAEALQVGLLQGEAARWQQAMVNQFYLECGKSPSWQSAVLPDTEEIQAFHILVTKFFQHMSQSAHYDQVVDLIQEGSFSNPHQSNR